MTREDITFPLFFILYAQEMGWSVPKFHIELCDWLDNYGPLKVIMIPRGHGKSTILEIYNAYKIYKNPNHLMLHQGATDSDAYKISRGTAAVLEKHPLTCDSCVKIKGEIQKWWVNGCDDVKHGNIHARGILSNVTGSRAHEIQNDDVECPNTTGSQDLRDKLAYRLSEQIHILIPGGSRLFVGTPHTQDSIYTKLAEAGADCLIRPMYQYSKRIMNVEKGKIYKLDDYNNYYVFSGVGSQSCIPKYYIINDHIIFKENYNLVDIYAEALWPERFTHEVMLQRRIECSNISEWDSQYQLESKPIDGNALDIDKFITYDHDVVYHKANRNTQCQIGSNIMSSVQSDFDSYSCAGTKKILVAIMIDNHPGYPGYQVGLDYKGFFPDYDYSFMSSNAWINFTSYSSNNWEYCNTYPFTNCSNNNYFAIADSGISLYSGHYYYILYSLGCLISASYTNIQGIGYIPLYFNGSSFEGETPPIINGSCGSAEGESFPYLDEESENLCATGSVSCPYAICYGGDVIDNGTTYYWKCEGSGEGATSEYCLAYVSTATAQCGYASGSYSTIQPTGTDACLYGVITDMTQNADDSWAWDCVVSETDYTSCETIASAPEIPGTLPSDDSIDCDISPTDLSTIGDCLGSVAKWLFLPHQETLNEFFQIPTTLQKKSPFGYFYAVGNLFKNLTTTPPSDLEFTMKNVDSTNMTLWKYSDFADFVGSENVKIYFSLIRALLWIGFAYWIYSKGRSLFNNSDSEK